MTHNCSSSSSLLRHPQCAQTYTKWCCTLKPEDDPPSSSTHLLCTSLFSLLPLSPSFFALSATVSQFACLESGEVDNHRVIVDGTRSETVFNGPVPLVDQMYTRFTEVLAGAYSMCGCGGGRGHMWRQGNRCFGSVQSVLIHANYVRMYRYCIYTIHTHAVVMNLS